MGQECVAHCGFPRGLIEDEEAAFMDRAWEYVREALERHAHAAGGVLIGPEKRRIWWMKMVEGSDPSDWLTVECSADDPEREVIWLQIKSDSTVTLDAATEHGVHFGDPDPGGAPYSPPSPPRADAPPEPPELSGPVA